MSKTKKVLIIAYLFPPIGGGGVQRALKMARYLREFGWEPHVLTVDPNYHVSLDHSLLKQLPDGVQIHRSKEIFLGAPPAAAKEKSGDQGGVEKRSIVTRLKQQVFPTLKKLKKHVLVPDDQILWFPYAAKMGLELMKEHQYDAIFSTSGPYTNHLVGIYLKRQTGVPWIADFRDPWTQNMHRPGIPWREWLEERLERMVLRESDILLTVTRSFANNFQQKFNDEIQRLEVIHNGFDPEDYKQLEKVKMDYPDQCSFIYTGIFYKERNPRLFLQAIKELLDEGVLDRKQIRLNFAGVFDYPGYTENADWVNKLGLNDLVHVLGHLPHQAALSELKKSDILLLIGDTAPGSGDYIPGKLFEYMAIGKPMLALSLKGESTHIIEKYQLGQVVDPGSLEEIKQGIINLYEEWLEAKEGKDRNQEVNRPSTLIYERKEQAKMLASLLNDLQRN
ncbi:glycosyltransferase family 4 protein [Ammoniphilus sp. CFH 90114]|uniref:glycosyltransferase family 4 protein n=1 Tax=Ammoniphilus sp. CFH 90114 TaxID=2493665 RepID=UPI00100E7864|nr:glycosyltransferase family 4 protein [Ammoniphilus sp. CFH 90114]RXT04736.1 glycosyltransferase [Ammoniphilus sp. CFH 90114]